MSLFIHSYALRNRRTKERLEDLTQLIFSYPYSSVDNVDYQLNFVALSLLFDFYADRDCFLDFWEFKSVWKQIDQYLLQSQQVKLKNHLFWKPLQHNLNFH